MKNQELPNVIELFSHFFIKDEKIVHFLESWTNLFFSFMIILSVFIFLMRFSKKLTFIPNRMQSFIEIIVEKYSEMVFGILGEKNGRRFLPYLGSLFFFILMSNLLALIPFLKAPTNSIITTASFAIPTFIYVQFVSIKENGILGYLYHFAGSPTDRLGWVLSPMMFVLHLISEFARPFSLSLRLFGNVLGEDIVLLVFSNLGIALLGGILAFIGIALPLGIPLQIPFYFVALLGGIVQAFVFSILATIYFLLALPHDKAHQAQDS